MKLVENNFDRIARALESLNISLISMHKAIESLELMERCRFFCGDDDVIGHSEYCSFEEDGVS